jgi:Ca2+-binding RTX toxin-like protein
VFLGAPGAATAHATLEHTVDRPTNVVVGTELTAESSLLRAHVNVQAPSGTLSFAVDGVEVPGCVGLPVQDSTATCTAQRLAPGRHIVDVTYSGAPGYASSAGTLELDNDPTAQDDTYSTEEATPLRVTAPGVLTNDNDPNGDALTAAVVTEPDTGTLTLNGDGSFNYIPADDLVGTVTFTYTASDGEASSNVATVTITVTEAVPIGCTITGTTGNDVLSGTARNDVICGLAGDDLIIGANGHDLIIGGSGNDLIIGGNGSDDIDGGSGNDVIIGGRGSDDIDGGSGNDVIIGGRGSDDIDGGSGNDVIIGGRGNDTLDANDGNAGNDHVNGGVGVDTCSADPGDILAACR